VRFLARFQRLERARTSRGGSRAATGERFAAIEPSGPLPEVRGGGLERFAPPVEPPVELAPRADAQPFVRCPACGVDSPVGSRRCGCGTALDTPEAVSFNASLWDRHRSEVASHEARQQALLEEDLRAARARQLENRALGEAIAREVAAREGVVRPGAVSRVAGAALLVGFLGLVLLPRGPLARGVYAALVAALAVRIVVGWTRGSDSGRPR